MRSEINSVLQQIFLPYDRDGCKGGSAADRVPGCSEKVGRGLPFFHKVSPRNDCAERKSRSYGFSHDNGIGHNIEIFDSEPFAGPAEALLDLLRNEKNSVFVAEFPEGLHVFLRRHHKP